MSKVLIISLLLGYFMVLVLISYFTSRKADNNTFYTGNKNNNWLLVAFGMIGASLSGVTFLSIPGIVEGSKFSYIQIALGYLIGYFVIAFVLLPLYYRLNLTSIYSYLEQRFGVKTYKMGAAFFILSRLIGSALRLYLVANILQTFVFDAWNIPFFATVSFSILLIWIYTHRGGMKTIIWTDTLQTLFMLIAVGMSIYLISDELNFTIAESWNKMTTYNLNTVFQTTDANSAGYWWKGILGGAFITLGMTGVDQDMMQKNLSCKNIGEAKKNMISFSIVLFFVNVVFVFLGGLLFLYAYHNPEIMERWAGHNCENDLLYATISIEGGLGAAVGIFFLLGLIAAAYSSADSALTALTTSLSIDFLNSDKKDPEQQVKIRKRSHIIMSLALLIAILIFKAMKSDSVIWELFKAANYTYGPLLGLFLFGIISKRNVKDILTIPISILVPIGVFFFNKMSPIWFNGYEFGSELLGVNALLVFICLWIFSTKNMTKSELI